MVFEAPFSAARGCKLNDWHWPHWKTWLSLLADFFTSCGL
eukprot:COSAG03_NODE_25622_length_264_cov_0.933333_1_plen_39_part_10